ncbi:MAG: glycoside hydrolase family 172 protein [bacterium]
MDSSRMTSHLPYLKDYRSAQESSYDRTGGNDDYVVLDAGERRTIAELEGPGCVSRIWMTVTSPDPYIYRTMVLRGYWDGESAPSIECPAGDFFGAGFCRYTHFCSEPLGMSSGGFYSYFPMPFEKSARFEIEVESEKRHTTVYYAIQYHRFSEAPQGVGYFHARWNRETTRAGENYTILKADGRGHYAGCFMHMQGVPRMTPLLWMRFWFLEGDEMIYVDGEGHPPALHGTGTEDYFNSGWYFKKGTFAGPYHGLTVKDWLRARISAYRFHVPDPVPFEREIRVTLEHGGTNDVPGSDYASVAYWYQVEPHSDWAPLPPAGRRLPRETALGRSRMRARGHVLDAGFEAFRLWKSLTEKKRSGG